MRAQLARVGLPAPKVIGIDELNDLAVLKVDARKLPVAKLGTSRGLVIGGHQDAAAELALGEWLERGGDIPLFQPLPGEEGEMGGDVTLSDLEDLPPATVAVLEAGGYRTLNDIIDLEKEDFLKLPGIAPAEADRIMKLINELTEEGAGADDGAGAEA